MACMAGTVRVFVRLRAVAVVALLAAPMTWGQAAASEGVQTVTDVLHQMSDQAGIIFMGQVLAVRRSGGVGPASEIVEVDFRVDQAIRGCRSGQPYQLREWGGLWAGGVERYRVGQRLLMLLHAPSAGGMSSPVGGLDGAIPIRQGTAGSQEKIGAVTESLTAPSSSSFVDLRWLGARLPRKVSYRSEAVRPASASSQLGATVQQAGQVIAAGSVAMDVWQVQPLEYTNASDASTPAQHASVDVVLGLLNTWQKAQHVTP